MNAFRARLYVVGPFSRRLYPARLDGRCVAACWGPTGNLVPVVIRCRGPARQALRLQGRVVDLGYQNVTLARARREEAELWSREDLAEARRKKRGGAGAALCRLRISLRDREGLMGKTVEAVDLFCGGGGTSTGLQDACERVGRRLRLRAINHWDVAVETHAANHPRAEHYCEPVDAVNPRKAVPKGRLDLLWASPECTHFSTARGGRPVNDQSRASAWCVLRWATALTIDTILIENVREFLTWGPVGADGRPLRRRRGETFAAFVEALRSLGYRVEWRVLNAADYGDATCRERLFIQARRGRRPLAWPEPTHGADRTLFGGLMPWRPARDVIDWTRPGASIFGRKRPLAANTIARIEAGLRRFGGPHAGPFLLLLRGTDPYHVEKSARPLDRPVPTLTAGGEHVGLCQPFLSAYHGDKGDGASRAHALDRPLPTLDTSNRFGLVQPFLVPNFGEREGQAPRSHALGRPLPTATGHGAGCLVQPFVLQMSQSGSNGHRSRPADRPLPTVTTADDLALVEPFLVKFNRTGGAHSLAAPVDTISTRDRFGLVQPDGPRLDILFRMLLPSELARAHSFPEDYRWLGTREDVVKLIGNSVPRRLAEALCLAVLAA